ncbi:uncharacterized protein LOC108144188 [Drosophila elegans]|uniref:uncharacterized protein LOC108144188 n=1 Tax=Drosophila elegans TaxID=30023 RepID=UPI0007E8AC63|nr:uncharacterized protein LOC108144188 [Drosophila elegans]
MNLEDISVMMKLCNDNVHKLQENLRSYQSDVNRVRTILTERWANVDRQDRRLIALHDQLVGSLSEVNAYVIQLNLHIELNRPAGRLRSEEKREDSFDSPNRLIKKAITDAISDEQPLEPDSSEMWPESLMQLVPVDLSMASKSMVKTSNTLEPPALSSKISPKPAITISNDISNQKSMTELQIIENAVVIDSKVDSTPFPGYSAAVNQNQPITTVKRHHQDHEPPIQKNSNNICKEMPKKIEEQQINERPVMPSSWLIKPLADQVTTSPPAATFPKLSKTPRNRCLLAPKGGTQTTSDGIYNQIPKNMDAFPKGTVISAVLVHANAADNCIFVAKWDKSSKQIQKLLQGQVPLREIDQLPNYGDIFAVYDSSDNITTRITINSSSEGGGYDAYLIDYGEHIHLSGNETIFELPSDIKALPAEAIRSNLMNYTVSQMSKFLYQSLTFRVHDNNGIGLMVELIDKEVTGLNNNKTEGPVKLSEDDMAMLNEIEDSTSNPLKAVLGFIPTDEQRICRHYDPKLNGCFKGNNCRLVHEPFAPDGATKDVEVAGALPETVFYSPVPQKMGSTVRILITFVNSPTEVYAQFVDGSAPLVWDKKDVPEEKRSFKRKPHLLDIVLALYSDGCFYRAQIIDEMDKEYKIFYVDYGNTEFVPLSCLAPCDYVESLKPHRCISCQIEGVIRSSFLSHQKTFECIEYLKSRLLNKEMDVKLINRLPDGFLIRFLGEYTEVPSQLVKRGYAQPSNGVRRSSIEDPDLDQPSADEAPNDI